ncbi:hypothetical protein QAD02_009869 [Eretmocerus hayati]|uniref:Uncharacterized protein n=1 Tax=Eretmocerus hayati TaxID=131215 RepID=A0ACC2NBD3_9HYME|nr:hypothetical protein QAD02_009869 [Eretmocerus hayati]
MIKLLLCVLIGCRYYCDALGHRDGDPIEEKSMNLNPRSEDCHGNCGDHKSSSNGFDSITDRLIGGENLIKIQPNLRFKRSDNTQNHSESEEMKPIPTPTRAAESEKTMKFELLFNPVQAQFTRGPTGRGSVLGTVVLGKGKDGLHGKLVLYKGYGNKPFISNSSSYEIANIKIMDDHWEIIRNMSIHGNDTLGDVIKRYNLEQGIHLNYGYLIEITVNDPDRFPVKVLYSNIKKTNENNAIPNFLKWTFENNTLKQTKSNSQIFIYVDGQFLLYEEYAREYLRSLSGWYNVANTWVDRFKRENEGKTVGYSVEQKADWNNNKAFELGIMFIQLDSIITIMKNREEIRKLKIRVNNLETKIRDGLSDLQDKLSEIQERLSNLEAPKGGCSKTFSFISPGSSLIPGIGTFTSAVSGMVGAACTMFGH